MTETPGRRNRQVARRYFESMEAERAGLKREIADLARTLDEAVRHHNDAHADCGNAPARTRPAALQQSDD